MKKKIAILTSGHPPFDERIFHKFAVTLKNSDYKVRIISSTVNIFQVKDDIVVEGFDGENLSKMNKINKFFNLLMCYEPEVIICCEPLPVYSAKKYQTLSTANCKILYDITEWYPENIVFKFSLIKKILNYIPLFLFNIVAANISDVIILGETRKKNRYDFFAPLKGKTIISYFPVLSLFNYFPPPFDGNNITLCFTGQLTTSRGLFTFLDICKSLYKKIFPVDIKIKIIGKFVTKEDEDHFNQFCKQNSNLKIFKIDWLKYEDIAENLKDVDLCFDLRQLNFIHRNSLPIKVFDYMAIGKPVIYSDIPALTEFLSVDEFGFTVNPKNNNSIIEIVSSLIKEKDKLRKLSAAGRQLAEEKYNWEKESVKLVKLIDNLGQL